MSTAAFDTADSPEECDDTGSQISYQSVVLESITPNFLDGTTITCQTTGQNWGFPIETFSSSKQSNLYKQRLPKPVRKFYKKQNRLISEFEDIHRKSQNEEVVQTEQLTVAPVRSSTREEKFGIKYSRATLILNLVLFAMKLVAVILSSSVALLGSLLDSIIDIVSGFVMWWAVKTARKRDPLYYPEGRSRLEPIGIIILCVIMSVASVELIINSIRRIIDAATGKQVVIDMSGLTIGLMTFTVVSKLIFFIIARGKKSPGIRALALDNRNDVLSNLTALIFGILANKVSVYFDPAGAVTMAIYILYSWVNQGWGQIKVLVGYTADSHFLQKIAFTCLNHSNLIKQLDTVRAFHFGTNFLVEVDIVLPETMTLKEAHDIGEPLQQKLERFPNVERAFVHLDYEFLHKPWIEHKIV